MSAVPVVPITLRMPLSLRKRLAKLAAEAGVSLNVWIAQQLSKEV